MNTMCDVPAYRSLSKIEKELRENGQKFSNYEISSLAVQIQRNEILAAAFVVSPSDKYPSALEKIAMALDGK